MASSVFYLPDKLLLQRKCTCQITMGSKERKVEEGTNKSKAEKKYSVYTAWQYFGLIPNNNIEPANQVKAATKKVDQVKHGRSLHSFVINYVASMDIQQQKS